MSEWKSLRIDQIGVLKSGATPDTANTKFWSGSINWITPSDLSKLRGRFIHKSERGITLKGLNSCSATLLPANKSIVISSRAPIGYIALPTTDFTTNQGCKSVQLFDEHDPSFHYYNLSHNVDKIKGRGEGTTFAEISKFELEKLQFSIPSLPVQRKIARILSTIDGQIEKTEAIIVKYQAIKQGMLQDLFTRGIDVRTGQLRPRYEDAPELYKESALGMIPTEWEVVSVQELSLEIKVGIVIKPTQYYKPEGVPMLRSFNVRAGYITMNDLVFMSEKDNNIQAKSRLCVGDVISVRTGYPGTSAVVTPNVAGCNCIDLVITKVNPTMLIPEFLADWTNSAFGMKQVFAKQGGNAQQHFNVGEMKKLRIPRVSFPEQQMIVKITHNIREVLYKEVDTLSKLQLLKQGLMQDLLSGKVEVEA